MVMLRNVLFLASVVSTHAIRVGTLGRTRSTRRAAQRDEPIDATENITQWVEKNDEGGEPCADCGDDDGKFAAQLQIAKEHVDSSYDGQMPVVVTKGFCDGVLAGIRAKKAPYWNEDARNCSPEREHVIAQCATVNPDFIETLEGLCPNSGKKDTGPSDGYKKVHYVTDIPRTADEKEAEKEKQPIQPLGEGAEAVPNSETGKPLWRNYPNPSSDEVDAKTARAQATPCDENVKDLSCGNQPDQYKQIEAEARQA